MDERRGGEGGGGVEGGCKREDRHTGEEVRRVKDYSGR